MVYRSSDSDELMTELVQLQGEVRKLTEMAARDGYLHPGTLSALMPIVLRVHIAADRIRTKAAY